MESQFPTAMFLGVIVISSTGVVIVLGVLLNTHGGSARGLIEVSPLIFVPLLERDLMLLNFGYPRSPAAAKASPSPFQQKLLPTPVNLNNFIFFLSAYKPSIIKFLCHVPNLLSAIKNPGAVNAKLAKELEADRLAGPFSSPPFPFFRLSPLGLVPKKTEDEFRLIHHLSFPRGSPLNDGISVEHTSVSYVTVEDAIRAIKAVGPSCYLAKTDIKMYFG